MKAVEEYFPLALVVILCLFLVLVLVTGNCEDTEPDNNPRKTPDLDYRTKHPDTVDDVLHPLREKVNVYQDFKR